ncbi:MAG: VWA domain-containing protein [Candidatus Krumholzibacteriia bacterium]
MEFADPEWLSALYAVPFLAWLLIYGARRRRKELLRFAGPHLRDSLAPGASWRKTLLKSILKITGFALLVLALARPQFGKQLVKLEREGIDLVIALDTSLSMMAEDMKPNRLERAKQEIVDLIRGLKGDRVGLVAFAGEAFVLCPLTVDYDAALMFVQTADVDIISQPGTALDKAIDTSIALFAEKAKSDRVVILVTDGEGHAGDPVASARRANDKSIRIYTIGIGNPAGELIPLRGTDGSVAGYKKDKTGETVLTRLDEKTLRLVSDASGGKFLPATRQGLELKVLYREISGMQKTTIEGEFVERKSDRFTWFLAAAFLLLGLETVVSRRGSMRNRRRPLHTGIMGAIVLVAFLPGAACAGSIDRGRVKAGNEYYDAGEYQKALLLYREAMGDTTTLPKRAEGVLYNQGNALHMMGKYEDALNRYNRSFTEDSLSAGRVFYNRGNTLARMGKLGEAIESYLRTLQYLPDDRDARHNLELALKQQQQNQQQQQQNKQDQQNKSQDQNQDQSDQKPGDRDKDRESQEGQQGSDQDQQQQPDANEEQPDSSQAPSPSESDSAQTDPQQQQARSIKLTREDALRILKLLEEQEKELQKAKRKAAFKRVSRSGKDW